LVSVGDHNAYQFNDGYVDVLNCITGMPPAADTMIYQPPPGDACLTLPPDKLLTNLTNADPNQRYSYSFLGSRQSLDHILVNSRAGSRFRTFGKPVVNSDFPGNGAPGNQTDRAERYSDHDPQVAYFTLPNEVSSKVNIRSSGLIYNRAQGSYNGSFTILNSNGMVIGSPLHVFFHGLPTGVTLANATGAVNGVPYITVAGALSSGQSSAAVPVRFAALLGTRVTYTTKTFSQTF
jgi:hypothetical protein